MTSVTWAIVTRQDNENDTQKNEERRAKSLGSSPYLSIAAPLHKSDHHPTFTAINALLSAHELLYPAMWWQTVLSAGVRRAICIMVGVPA